MIENENDKKINRPVCLEFSPENFGISTIKIGQEEVQKTPPIGQRGLGT